MVMWQAKDHKNYMATGNTYFESTEPLSQDVIELWRTQISGSLQKNEFRVKPESVLIANVTRLEA